VALLKIAQIGAGYWGPNLIRNFVELSEIKEFVVCDIDETRLKKIKRSYETVTVCTSADQVLDDKSIDAIVIALPAHKHFEFAKRALLQGKHVFVEKPLCMNMKEARELIDINKRQKKVVMVGHTFLYNEAVRRVKAYIDEGVLGEIYYVFSQRLNLGRVREDVNVMWNLAPHDISIINYWFSEMPSRVQAKGLAFLQKGIADVAFLNLDFPSGKFAHIHVSWLDPSKTRKMVVVGSKKMLVYDDVVTDGKITIYDKGVDRKNIVRDLPDIESFGQFQLMHRSGDVTMPRIDFKEPLQVECQEFIQCIVKGRKSFTDEFHGAEVVEVLEKADKAMQGS
jgi:predicted dehydrogenase